MIKKIIQSKLVVILLGLIVLLLSYFAYEKYQEKKIADQKRQEMIDLVNRHEKKVNDMMKWDVPKENKK